jgi:hypothetical protein
MPACYWCGGKHNVMLFTQDSGFRREQLRGKIKNGPPSPCNPGSYALSLLSKYPKIIAKPVLPRIRDTGRYVADRYLSSAEAAILSFEAACRCGRPHAQLPKHPPPLPLAGAGAESTRCNRSAVGAP